MSALPGLGEVAGTPTTDSIALFESPNCFNPQLEILVHYSQTIFSGEDFGKGGGLRAIDFLASASFDPSPDRLAAWSTPLAVSVDGKGITGVAPF